MKNIFLVFFALIFSISGFAKSGYECIGNSQNDSNFLPVKLTKQIGVGSPGETYLKASVFVKNGGYWLDFTANEVNSFKGRLNLEIIQILGKSIEEGEVVTYAGAGIIVPSKENAKIAQYLDMPTITYNNVSDVVSITCKYLK